MAPGSASANGSVLAATPMLEPAALLVSLGARRGNAARAFAFSVEAPPSAKSFEEIERRIAKEPLEGDIKTGIEVFHQALDRVRPSVEVRSKRVGGANYQVPIQINRRRQQSMTFRWIITAAREDKGKPMHLRLAKELLDAARGEGKAVQTRTNTHRMAEANKAFAHFAW